MLGDVAFDPFPSGREAGRHPEDHRSDFAGLRASLAAMRDRVVGVEAALADASRVLKAATAEGTAAIRFMVECRLAMELDDLDEMVRRRDVLAARLASTRGRREQR